MTIQTDLASYINDFSFQGVQNQLQAAENATLQGEDIKITLYDFTHVWTLDDIQTNQELQQELEQTTEAARERLRQGLMSEEIGDLDEQEANRVLQEKIGELEFEPNPAVQEFEELKTQFLPRIRTAANKAKATYEGVDKQRVETSGNLLTENTENVDEYLDNIDKADQNLEFEQLTSVQDTESDAFSPGRQRTTGDLSWYNQQGEKRFMLILPNEVVLQTERGGETLQEFEDKAKARQFYLQNRVG